MARYTKTISPEAAAVLRACSYAALPNGAVLRLPSGQLDRKFYQEVNGVLEALGAKWNRKLQGHLGPSDLALRVAEALADGQAVDADKVAGFFWTPLAVARRVIDLAEIGDKHIVLEPSAGEGHLLATLRVAHPGHRGQRPLTHEGKGRLRSPLSPALIPRSGCHAGYACSVDVEVHVL